MWVFGVLLHLSSYVLCLVPAKYVISCSETSLFEFVFPSSLEALHSRGMSFSCHHLVSCRDPHLFPTLSI